MIIEFGMALRVVGTTFSNCCWSMAIFLYALPVLKVFIVEFTWNRFLMIAFFAFSTDVFNKLSLFPQSQGVFILLEIGS